MDGLRTTLPSRQGTSGGSLHVLLMSSRRPLSGGGPVSSVAALKAKVLEGLRHVTVDNPDADWKALPFGGHRWLLKVLDKFAEREHLEMHVRFVHWHRALHDIAHVYGREYDVIQVPSTFLAYLADMGSFLPLTDLCTSLYVDGLLESCQTQSDPGVYYAVPWHADARVVYYRDAEEKKWKDFSDFVGWLKCCKGDDDKRRPFGVAVGPDGDILHTTLYYFLGGHIIEQDSGGQWVPVFDEKRFSDGLQRLDAIAREGLVHWLTPAPDERTSQVSAKALLDGQCDAVFGGPWMRTVFKGSKAKNIHAAVLPPLSDGGEKRFLGGSHLAVSAAAGGRGDEQVLLARALIDCLTDEENSVALFRKAGALPANNDALGRFETGCPRWKALAEAVQDGRVYPSIPQWAPHVERDVVLDDFLKVLESIRLGEDWPYVEAQLAAAAERLRSSLTTHTAAMALIHSVRQNVETIASTLRDVSALVRNVPALGELVRELHGEVTARLGTAASADNDPLADVKEIEVGAFSPGGPVTGDTLGFKVTLEGGATVEFTVENTSAAWLAALLRSENRTIDISHFVWANKAFGSGSMNLAQEGAAVRSIVRVRQDFPKALAKKRNPDDWQDAETRQEILRLQDLRLYRLDMPYLTSPLTRWLGNPKDAGNWVKAVVHDPAPLLWKWQAEDIQKRICDRFAGNWTLKAITWALGQEWGGVPLRVKSGKDRDRIRDALRRELIRCLRAANVCNRIIQQDPNAAVAGRHAADVAAEFASDALALCVGFCLMGNLPSKVSKGAARRLKQMAVAHAIIVPTADDDWATAALALVACLGEVSSAPPWYAEVRTHLAWPWLEGVLRSLELGQGKPPDLNDPLVLAVLANAWPAGPQWLEDAEKTTWFEEAFEDRRAYLVNLAENETKNRKKINNMNSQQQVAFSKKLRDDNEGPAKDRLLSEITMGLNAGAFPWLCTDADQLKKELMRRVRSDA